MLEKIKKTDINLILVYLIIIVSFLSYEMNIYNGYYNHSLFLVMLLGILTVFSNLKKVKYRNEFFRNFILNSKINILIGAFIIVTYLNLIFGSQLSILGLLTVLSMCVSIYIFFIFLPVILNNNLEKFIKMIVYLITFFSLISIIIAAHGNFLMYEATHYRRIASIFFDPNYFGTIAGVGVLLSLDFKQKKIFFLLPNFFALLLSGSRAALLGLLVVFFVSLLIYNKRSWKQLIKILFFSIVVYLVFSYSNQISFFRVHQGLNQRDEMWVYFFRQIKENPILGYGRGASSELLSKIGYQYSSSHNTYLDFIVMFGIPTFVIYFWVLIKSLLNGINRQVNKSVILSIIFLLIVANFISINLGGLGLLSMLLTIFLGISNLQDNKLTTSIQEDV